MLLRGGVLTWAVLLRGGEVFSQHQQCQKLSGGAVSAMSGAARYLPTRAQCTVLLYRAMIIML
eukprot:1329170-Rhodomonas_salina.2